MLNVRKVRLQKSTRQEKDLKKIHMYKHVKNWYWYKYL